MAYEIPQQLEYSEKIIFGLTFKQLAYLFLFAPLGFVVFFKSHFNIYSKIFLLAIISSLGTGFIFLNLDFHLKNWIAWLRFRKVIEKNKLEKFSGIKEVKDDFVILHDGKKIAILKVEPVNFSIKQKDSQEEIISSFQKFLNSLDFPVQIMMNTESLNLSEYLEEIRKRQNKDFGKLFQKYREYLEKLISENKILNRNFYLIIPEKNDIGIQIQLCEKRIENIGLKSSRLKNYELNAILYKSFNNLGAYHPSGIENNPNFIKVGDGFSRIIYAHGYPRNVESGFLDKIVSLIGDFDLSIHIEPNDIETTMVNINKELQKQRADLYSAELKGIINPSLEIKYKDTKNTLENLQKGNEKLFNVSMYVNCRAKTLEELELISRRIESELNSLLIIPRVARFRMAQGFQSSLPISNNKLKITRNVPTGALSAFFPFTSSFLQADAEGIWLGLNKNNIPIIKDIFKLSNPNGFCLASSGSGKSYMAKLFIARQLLHGVKVIVIDPQGEYRGIVSRFSGQRIDLSTKSKTIINPLDLMGHEYQEKRLALMDLMPIMLGELTEPQKAFIDKAITLAYEQRGISEDPATWNNKPPKLEDVLMVLEKMERRAITLEKTTIRSLINRLSMYVTGVFSFLNNHTNINFDNKFTCFDIGNLPKQVKPVLMFLVLDYVYMKMKRDLERKLLVIDEAWSLLSRAEDASYIFEIVKTCRKFNLALFLINQEVEGMISSEAGRSVLANSSYTILLRQKPAVIEGIREVFHLSNAEKTFLLTASVGEGILLMDDEHSEIRIVASEEEHNQITTNPDEILLLNKAEKNEVAKKPKIKQLSVMLNVDPEKKFHHHKKLKLDDVKYLISKGFTQIKTQNIFGKNEIYLIKPRANEGKEHFFLSCDIAEYLETKKIRHELFNSVKPDIVFEVNGKKFAVEVETGKLYVKDKRKLIAKVKNLKKDYGNNWFFVVTDRNFISKYKQFGTTYTKRNILAKLEETIKNA